MVLVRQIKIPSPLEKSDRYVYNSTGLPRYSKHISCNYKLYLIVCIKKARYLAASSMHNRL